MTTSAFQIEFTNPHWITEDSKDDLCAHGKVTIIFESQIVEEEEDLCITTGSLYLLRSLFKNISAHEGGFEEDDYLIPHCGHAWLAQKNCVLIMGGCSMGVGWNVTHNGEMVILDGFPFFKSPLTDHPIQTTWQKYAQTILEAAVYVRDFHESEPPRQFFDDEARAGHDAFWAEFEHLLVLARDRINK